MVIYKPIIIDFSQLSLAMGWWRPLHAWLAIMNVIVWARWPNTHYSYEARDMDNHISLCQNSQNYYT